MNSVRLLLLLLLMLAQEVFPHITCSHEHQLS